MPQEAAYIKALWDAATYRVMDDRLEIDNAAGETILIFTLKEEMKQPGDASEFIPSVARLGLIYLYAGIFNSLSASFTYTIEFLTDINAIFPLILITSPGYSLLFNFHKTFILSPASILLFFLSFIELSSLLFKFHP